MMPPPLAVAVDALHACMAGVEGWVSDAVSHIVAIFLAGYLNVATGGRVVGVTWNKEEETYDTTVVQMFASPFVFTTSVVIAILVVIAVAIIGITLTVFKYEDVRIEELKTERMQAYTEAVADKHKLLEEGKISEETYKSANEALTHALDVITASTPAPTWHACMRAS